MKPLRKMTQGELAAFVDSQLQTRGIEVVLSGGASVAIYTHGKYVSADIDLVNAGFASDRALGEAMSEMGFTRDGRHFVHPEVQYFVEFPPGPLAVGQELVKVVDRMNFRTGTLRIISPTDCVKDRLAAYYHWNDLQCLEQAVLVARDQVVDLREIQRWSAAEGKGNQFAEIRGRLLG